VASPPPPRGPDHQHGARGIRRQHDRHDLYAGLPGSIVEIRLRRGRPTRRPDDPGCSSAAGSRRPLVRGHQRANVTRARAPDVDTTTPDGIATSAVAGLTARDRPLRPASRSWSNGSRPAPVVRQDPSAYRIARLPPPRSDVDGAGRMAIARRRRSGVVEHSSPARRRSSTAEPSNRRVPVADSTLRAPRREACPVSRWGGALPGGPAACARRRSGEPRAGISPACGASSASPVRKPRIPRPHGLIRGGRHACRCVRRVGHGVDVARVADGAMILRGPFRGFGTRRVRSANRPRSRCPPG